VREHLDEPGVRSGSASLADAIVGEKVEQYPLGDSTPRDLRGNDGLRSRKNQPKVQTVD